MNTHCFFFHFLTNNFVFPVKHLVTNSKSFFVFLLGKNLEEEKNINCFITRLEALFGYFSSSR